MVAYARENPFEVNVRSKFNSLWWTDAVRFNERLVCKSFVDNHKNACNHGVATGWLVISMPHQISRVPIAKREVKHTWPTERSHDGDQPSDLTRVRSCCLGASLRPRRRLDAVVHYIHPIRLGLINCLRQIDVLYVLRTSSTSSSKVNKSSMVKDNGKYKS
jgi:hypothetical protein